MKGRKSTLQGHILTLQVRAHSYPPAEESYTDKQTNEPIIIIIRLSQSESLPVINMAVLFWYFVKSDASVRYRTLGYTGQVKFCTVPLPISRGCPCLPLYIFRYADSVKLKRLHPLLLSRSLPYPHYINSSLPPSRYLPYPHYINSSLPPSRSLPYPHYINSSLPPLVGLSYSLSSERE